METSNILSAYYSRMVQALPPEHQQAREEKRILEHPRTKEVFGDLPFDIQKIGNSYFLVAKDMSVRMQVDIKYLPPEKPICGPAEFDLVFHTPVMPR